MRAGMFIEALAQCYRVSLLVIPAFGGSTPTAEALITEHCAESIVVEPRVRPSFWTELRAGRKKQPEPVRFFARQASAAVEAVRGRQFDVIHTFRLYTAPVALAIAASFPGSARPSLHLDLDDVGTVTHARIAQIYHLNRRLEDEAKELEDAALYTFAEREFLPLFERVYVCSPGDGEAIRPLIRGELSIVPNAVRPPEHPPGRRTTHPYTFLFVGNLSYFPNEDGVRFFCNEVLPLLRKRAAQPFLVRIVGANMPSSMFELSRHREVRLVGRVHDVGLEYGDANAVIVPLRAGGGTRIKVLEAFAFQRPVISTTIGIEGIEAVPDRDFLLGDDPFDFAEQCVRLMEDPALGRALTEQASALLRRCYTQETVNQLVAGLS